MAGGFLLLFNCQSAISAGNSGCLKCFLFLYAALLFPFIVFTSDNDGTIALTAIVYTPPALPVVLYLTRSGVDKE
jgi:hypothetical protein